MPDRLIKESSCTSDTLNALSDFGERFWWRLTVNCDDYGRCDARPAVLKSKLFPLAEDRTSKDMENTLQELTATGLVIVYEVDKRPYLQIVKWEKHQRIRAKRSKYPSPEEGVCCHLPANDSKCPRNPIQSESNPNTNQSIGKADKPLARPRFNPPTVDEVRAYCYEKDYGVDADRFVDYYTSNGWRVGKNPMKDWKAAVRSWNGKDQQQNGKTESKPLWTVGTTV